MPDCALDVSVANTDTQTQTHTHTRRAYCALVIFIFTLTLFPLISPSLAFVFSYLCASSSFSRFHAHVLFSYILTGKSYTKEREDEMNRERMEKGLRDETHETNVQVNERREEEAADEGGRMEENERKRMKERTRKGGSIEIIICLSLSSLMSSQSSPSLALAPPLHPLFPHRHSVRSFLRRRHVV